jgi:hypothetical protein
VYNGVVQYHYHYCTSVKAIFDVAAYRGQPLWRPNCMAPHCGGARLPIYKTVAAKGRGASLLQP